MQSRYGLKKGFQITEEMKKEKKDARDANASFGKKAPSERRLRSRTEPLKCGVLFVTSRISIQQLENTSSPLCHFNRCNRACCFFQEPCVRKYSWVYGIKQRNFTFFLLSFLN